MKRKYKPELPIENVPKVATKCKHCVSELVPEDDTKED